jgi:DNA-binding transcriptional ArsR family regulator
MFANGADGVLVTGCHPGDCHYLEGNLYAERRIKMLKKLMACASLEPERLRLEWVSASEGGRFAELVNEFTNQIKALGPSPLAGKKPDSVILENTLAAKSAAEDFRLRVLVGREKELIEEGNVYGEKTTQEEFDKTMNQAVQAEYVRNKIYFAVKKEPKSIKELSKRLDLSPQVVLRHIVVLRRRGMVTLDRVEGTTPLYTALEVGR